MIDQSQLKKIYKLRKESLAYPCPECNAEPYTPCHRLDGSGYRKTVHNERMERFLGRNKVGIQTFKVELRIDVQDAERSRVIKEAVVTAARELLGVTSLLSEGPKPSILVTKAAFFEAEETIDIKEA